MNKNPYIYNVIRLRDMRNATYKIKEVVKYLDTMGWEAEAFALTVVGNEYDAHSVTGGFLEDSFSTKMFRYITANVTGSINLNLK